MRSLPMLPRPSRATTIEATRLGNDVPAADNVIPMTAAGMPARSPMASQHVHITNDRRANQITHVVAAIEAF